MKELIAREISKAANVNANEIINLIEIPPSQDLGDFAFPCFILAKQLKKSPTEIAANLASKIKSEEFDHIEAKGPYLNFFLNKKKFTLEILNNIFKQKDKYGSSNEGKGKVIVLDMSSPNIAKPFGIGHLRSTIIGNSISEIYQMQGYKTVKINYLGDWGTQFGKLIVGYKRFGNSEELKKNPIKHLLALYVEANKEEYEQEARDWFKKLEEGDKEAIKLWKLFKKLSLKEFDKLYKLMNIKFDVVSGESLYNGKMDKTIEELKVKKLLIKSEGAEGVDLENFGLGFCLIRKSDGATLYATRDITAAIERYSEYRFTKMIYEVGQEQKLHFQQFFKVLELMGHTWAKDCTHVSHGLYLASDGKKFATREGKTVFMEDIFNETISLAKSEIAKREKLLEKELEKRAVKIAIAAIFYGDLKNYRVSDAIFDINRFVSFEGNTGPYLLYSYARARSILRKAKYKLSKFEKIEDISEKERSLIMLLAKFPNVVYQSAKNLSPNLIANYAFEISQSFNEFYHAEQVIGSEKEKFRLALVNAFSQVLKNALSLLGIPILEKM
jgi:arginyl-tRNA synthetase